MNGLHVIAAVSSTAIFAFVANAEDRAAVSAKTCDMSAEELKAARIDLARRTTEAVALFPTRWSGSGPAVDDEAWETMRAAFRTAAQAARGVAPCVKGDETTDFTSVIAMLDTVAAESRSEWVAKATENGRSLKDRVGPTIVALGFLKVKAERDIEAQLPSFASTWSLKGGTFTMRAAWSAEWKGKLDKLGLGDLYVPLRVDMKNDSAKDVQFNPLVERFVVITRESKQFNTIAIAADLRLHQAFAGLTDEERQLLFTEIRTVYSGSEQPMIVLLPAQATPESWRSAVFESAMGAAGGALPTMKFKPAPPKARPAKSAPQKPANGR